MSMFDDATAAHFAALFRMEGIEATIARSGQSCDATIVLGQPEKPSVAEQDFSVESDDQDIIVAAADYQPTGSAVTPAIGDTITATVLGVVRSWRVVVRSSQQTHKPMDLKRTYFRVYSKEQ